MTLQFRGSTIELHTCEYWVVDEFAMLAIEQAQRVAWVKAVVYGVFVEVTAQPFRRVDSRRWV